MSIPGPPNAYRQRQVGQSVHPVAAAHLAVDARHPRADIMIMPRANRGCASTPSTNQPTSNSTISGPTSSSTIRTASSASTTPARSIHPVEYTQDSRGLADPDGPPAPAVRADAARAGDHGAAAAALEGDVVPGNSGPSVGRIVGGFVRPGCNPTRNGRNRLAPAEVASRLRRRITWRSRVRSRPRAALDLSLIHI